MNKEVHEHNKIIDVIEFERKVIRQGYRKVPISFLTSPMRIVVPELQGSEHLSVNSLFYLINTQEDIDKLESLNIQEVWLHEDHISPKMQGTLLSNEFTNSVDFYQNSKKVVEDFFNNVREGELPAIEEFENIVNHVTESIVRHPTALLCMKGLQDIQSYTYFHSINVALICAIFAQFLGYTTEEIKEVTLAGLLHDIGKQKISLDIINAPRKLTQEEFKIVQRHPIFALEILQNNKEISKEVFKAILEHHEKYDGTGYPRGLGGDQIHPYSSIVSLADVYDALTSERAYKKAIPQNKTASFVYSQKSVAFPPVLTELFIRCFGVYPIGSLVKIDATQYAVVCENNKNDLLRPKVLEITKRQGEYAFTSLEPIDLRQHKDKYRITGCENLKWDVIQIKNLLSQKNTL